MAEKKPLSKREKILVGITTAVAVIACIKFWYLPQFKQHRETNIKISELQAQIAASTAAKASLSAKRVPASDYLGLDIQDMVTKNASLPLFVGELTAKAEQSSFHLRRVEVTEQNDVEGLVKSDFKIIAQASFAQLGVYLESLENSPFVAQVNSVQIFRDKDDLQQLTTQLDLSTFHLPKRGEP